MRSASLSNTKVISYLNSYFIPVFLSNEDYEGKGAAPPEERAELRRVFEEGYAAKKSVGTVHAYVLKPDGHLFDSMHVAQAYKAENLLPMLEKTVRALNTPAGTPVIKPTPQPAPQAEPDTLLLHLTSRYLRREGEKYVLTGQENSGGDWSTLPSEDWITLKKDEWTKLLPPRGARVGQGWDVERGIATTLLLHFYPPTENWDLTTNRIDALSLKATVLTAEIGLVRIRLDGALTMKHPFSHKDDDRFVEARVVGYVEIEPDKRRIRSLRLVTDEAEYRGHDSKLPYGVALRSVP